jgi:DNA-binding MarR family transcriptional regulator
VIGSSHGLRANELAELVGMSRPSMSRLMVRLERGGVAIAEVDPTDGRATIVRLTPLGLELVSDVTIRRRALIASALNVELDRLPGNLAAGFNRVAAALEVRA